MPYELGGRADKEGNRYEIKYAVLKLLEVIEEKIDYVILEALGDDEQGVDLWIGNKNGTREGQQCKGRNGSENSWTYGAANTKNIFRNWSTQLKRDLNIQVSLVTPIAFQFLEDLIKRAQNSSEDENDFYDYQIKKSSVEFQSFYTKFMKSMQLNIESPRDIQQSIQYLNRIHFHQVPDSYLKEMILQKISYLFVGNEKQIYAGFIQLIIDEDILGKKVNITVLRQFIKDNGYHFKNLAFDTRIVPRIEQLNKEYRDNFQSLNGSFIKRQVHDECCELINNEASIILHGKAGMGKSGTTEAIINYCELKSIPYLAIKLDKRIPNNSAKKWGEELGFPDSIAHCLHSISKNEQAVLVLDQLDALRWTLAHSRNALLVCSEIIEQVTYLNKERENKISIVMVCRTIDYESDNNIKNLFKVDSTIQTDFRWHEVKVGELDNNETEDIVGTRYQSLTPKLRSLLKIPSNLFIWCQLEHNTLYDECLSTNHLIMIWWNQLLRDYFSPKQLDDFKKNLVDKFIEFERIYILERFFQGNRVELDFLASNGFINISNHKISFAHQSILDFLLAEKMLDKYLTGVAMSEILGNKEAQTPGKRYQLQMLMQSLLEIESRDFIEVGKQLLENDDIRFFNKYVFFEILRDIDDIDTEIEDFILEYCENEQWQEHLLTNVIQSKVGYYKLLLNNGIIEKWLSESDTKSDAINLIASISPIYDSEDVELIKKFIFLSEEYSREFARCFHDELFRDIDEMFELKLKLYEKYPDLNYVYIDFKEAFKQNELRMIKYFAFIMENKLNGNINDVNHFKNELYLNEDEFSIHNGEEVFSELIRFVPKENKGHKELDVWSVNYRETDSIERIVVKILKKAITTIIAGNSIKGIQIINDLSKYSSDIINELILDGLFKLNESFSDFVIDFICCNFEDKIFNRTAGESNLLFKTKRILEKHSLNCNDELFVELQNKIIPYKLPNAKDYLKYRVEHNKKNRRKLYSSFWGDLQLELLSVLPIERLSQKSFELLNVLKRRGASSRYEINFPQSGFVVSPVTGKQLSVVDWSKIIKKKKEDFTSKERWKNYSGNFVESSIEMFASSFSEAVKNDPVEMINLVINNQENVSPEFIDAVYSGLTSSETLRNVSKDLLEKLFLKFPSDLESQRAIYFCRIVKNLAVVKWSDAILNMLIEIATKHSNPLLEKPVVTNSKDKEMRSFDMLSTNCLNSVRAVATLALSKMLWENLNYFEMLKPIIIKITNDPNPAVRLASVHLLEPIINIDKEWASKKIVELYVEDFRLAGSPYLKDILFIAFEQHREQILTTILKCFYSEDKDLVRIGAYALAEMNLIHNQFEGIIKNVEIFTEEQASAFLEMVVLYFNKDEYNAKCKELMLAFKNSDYDLEVSLSKLFCKKLTNLERDRDFLIQLMTSTVNHRLLYSFVKFLEEEHKALVEYSEIILSLSGNLIENFQFERKGSWNIESKVAKLIIGLYDETFESERPINKRISNQSLDLWDKMFEFRIGSMRNLSNEIMSR